MRSHNIPEARESFSERPTLDLIAILRSYHRLDKQAPTDLLEVLVERGENVRAIMVDIERGK